VEVEFKTGLRLFCPTDLTCLRSSGGEFDLYTGTLIKDLLALVERAERDAASKSKPLTSPSASGISTSGISTSGISDDSGAENHGTKARRSEPKQFPQPLCLGAADWNLALLLIIHAQLVRTLEPGHNFANAINIHQVGTVSAPEQTRIQASK